MIGLMLAPIFILLLVAGAIVMAVFYLKNLQDLMYEVAPHNQQVPPGNVWLMFIPLFNIIYPFILYPKICDSVRAEFEERGAPQEGDYGRGIGVALPILGLCGIIPFIGVLASLANLVLFIVFWVKMAEQKNKLRATPATAESGTGVKFNSDNDLLD